MPRERELKYDLGDEESARRIETLLPDPAAARWQVNRFFDTPAGDLRRRRCALRLRAEWRLQRPDEEPAGPPAGLVLSLKGPRRGGGDLHDREEREAAAPLELWSQRSLVPADLPAAWRARLPRAAVRGGAPLIEIACFENLRRTHPLPPAWQVEIDRTFFGGGRRAWEIEMEIGAAAEAEAAQAALLALLARAGVAAQPQGRSKLERALASGDGPAASGGRGAPEVGP